MIKKKKWLLITSLCFLALGGSCAVFAGKSPLKSSNKVSSVLDTLTKNEKRDLEAFLKYLFFKEGFAFVSVGEIPVSFAGFVDLKNCDQELIYLLKNVRSASSLEDSYSEQIVVNRGWLVWQKIQDHCNQKDLILKQVKDDDNYIYLMIINKKNFREVYDHYKEYFDRELNHSATREGLVTSFCDHQYPFTEVLKDSRILKGILLGFGVHNTEQYDRLRKISIQIEMLKDMHATDSEEFKSLCTEEKELNQKLSIVSWPEQFEEKKIRARKFTVEASHDETQKLIEQYLSDLEKIKETYKDKDFLLITLESFFE